MKRIKNIKSLTPFSGDRLNQHLLSVNEQMILVTVYHTICLLFVWEHIFLNKERSLKKMK
jgi:hypothetical protein